MSAPHTMSAKDALIAIHSARRDEDVVVTTMATARDWMTLPQNPRDLVFVPSAMSHATSIGMGLALAQPDRRVIVCNGDGSMLMNLGSLVSIAGANVSNMIVIVFDNGVYEVTGAQLTPGSNRVDFATVARGAGFKSVDEFRDLADWQHGIHRILNVPGPTFVCLRVAPTPGIPGPKSPGPAGPRAKKLIEGLRVKG